MEYNWNDKKYLYVFIFDTYLINGSITLLPNSTIDFPTNEWILNAPMFTECFTVNIEAKIIQRFNVT